MIYIKNALLIVLSSLLTVTVSAQAVSTNGQITSTSSSYVSSNGAIGTGTGVNANGQIVTSIAVGYLYKGGIIYYIFTSSDPGYVAGETHGLIAATADVGSKNIPWGCQGTLLSGFSSGIGSGRQNTNAILAGCSTAGIAAQVATTYNGGGYTDWYLPSIAELQILFQNRGVVGGFDTKLVSKGGWPFYWSSSQGDDTYGTGMHFDNCGSTQDFFKSNTYRVRPIRTF